MELRNRHKGIMAGIGTVLAAFTMGKVVGIIGTYTDKFFYFETYKTLKKTDTEIK